MPRRRVALVSTLEVLLLLLLFLVKPAYVTVVAKPLGFFIGRLVFSFCHC